MDASYEEKTAWITLTGLLLGFGAYGSVAWRMWQRGVDVTPAYAPLFAITVVGMVVFLVVVHTATAMFSRSDDVGASDERDRLIAWRSESRSSWILGAGVLLALNSLVFGVNDVLVAHLLLGSLVLSEMTKVVLQILAYRRGV